MRNLGNSARRRLGIADDEPIFIIRGQDQLAVMALKLYEDLAIGAECGPTFLENLRQKKQQFEQFRIAHSEVMKRPD